MQTNNLQLLQILHTHVYMNKQFPNTRPFNTKFICIF